MQILRAVVVLFFLAGRVGAATLASDEHLGKVVDAQGTVSLKPAEQQRWTPVCGRLLLMPGDWLRTDLRGANAAEVHLQDGGKLILGPGSLIELIKPGEIRVHLGELAATPAPRQALRLLGPQKQVVVVEASSNLRIDGDKLVTLDREPKWLQGFKGTIKNETLGSLVAKIDGRDVPLSVGYHKVTVDIHDQIARTVIEESFVNHTKGILEGVFYFPLPADASISGFGMWIGSDLVEADVVEKQRAREIYETILRERRDPGLLEWAGGNLFKARVFPIPGEAEKRIKISYTQVLPLRGRTYRYSYALESELLKQHPLAELSLDVKISSALPLANVSCSTHDCRIAKTVHAGHVEFSAQEYSPDRDFEVAIELARGRPDVVLVPHQRAGDGYFLLMISPPGADNAWQRELLADGEPLRLLILADTSGSMDAAQRKTQDAFLAALLGSLGPRDTFNLAACDVDCNWASPDDLAAGEKNTTKVRNFLAARRSLGWTNLDEAFAAVLKRTKSGTHVIYIGDGIVTAPDADPAAFANRLKRLSDGQPGTFHAVACGSKFELPVLKAIGAIGGGSLRKIQAGAATSKETAASSETGPAAVARQLLSELTQPGLRDLKIEFSGLRTARVYPEQLPNVPAGTQQIVLGRYLPEGKEVAGQVIVTARQGAETVRLRADVSVPDAEQGNAFIPRLWARQHLDALVDQGHSQSIQDEIIALSEEYQIMTPYTSFLVLESDADRERFKVKRRFQMRDGQKFFAAGRDQADYELVQQQMKRAGAWRLNLRNQILKDLARMGRNPDGFQSNGTRLNVIGPSGLGGMGSGFLPRSRTSAVEGLFPSDRPDLLITETFAWHDRRGVQFEAGGEPLGDDGDYDEADFSNQLQGRYGESGEWNAAGDADDLLEFSGEGLPSPWYQTDDVQYFSTDPELKLAPNSYGYYGHPFRRWPSGGMGLGGNMGGGMGGGRGFYIGTGRGWNDPYESLLHWLQAIVPALPDEPVAETPLPGEQAWPAEARAISASLLRTSKLTKIDGLVFESQTDTFDPRNAALTGRAFASVLFGGESWVAVRSGDAAQTIVDWADGKQRGVYSRLYELGRVRASGPLDRATPPLTLHDYSIMSLERSFAWLTPKLEVQDKDRTLVSLLPYPSSSDVQMRILIDTQRRVVLSVEQFRSGKLDSTVRFSDFVNIAGRNWATRAESFDNRGRRTELVSLKIAQVGAGQIAKRMQDQLKDRQQMLLLNEPLPSLAAAKQAVLSGKATASDRMTLLVHFAGKQNWSRAGEQQEALEQLVPGKDGLKWIADGVLFDRRRHEELKDRLLAQSAAAAQRQPDGNQLALAGSLINLAGQTLEAHEMLGLLDVLQPAFDRHPEHVSALRQWNSFRATYLQSSGQPDAAIELQRKLAEQYPTDSKLQQQYAHALVSQNDYEAAIAWLRRALASDVEWTDQERDGLDGLIAYFLESQGRLEELTELLAGWVGQNSTNTSLYGQYLDALLHSGQHQQADRLVRRWLRRGSRAEPTTSPAGCRLQAALRLALGQNHYIYSNRIDPRWLEPLAKTAVRLAENPALVDLADQIMSHHVFQNSDQASACRKEFTRMLVEQLDTLSPRQAGHLIGWIQADNPPVDAATWQQIIAGLERRWAAAADLDAQHVWASAIVKVLSKPKRAAELLAFLERQLRVTNRQHHAADANELFEALLEQPWSPAVEDRAFELLTEISDDPQPEAQLLAQVEGLHQLVDRLLAGRAVAIMAEVEHVEDLTRTELIAKRRDASSQARTDVAHRLTRERGKHGEPLAPWLTIERIWIDVQLQRDLDKVAGDVWEFLGNAPRKLDAEPTQTLLGQILAERYLATAANLAASPQTKPEWTERLLKYLQAGIEQQPDNPIWKTQTYRLLVALDRPQPLEALLRGWIRPELADNTWRIGLGYLLAEQGKLDEAVRLFEKVETDDELGPAEYQSLAAWYLAKNAKEQHEQALAAMYAATDEDNLSQSLNKKINPWYQSDKLPAEFDPEILRLYSALLKRSAYPQNYLAGLAQVYRNSRDFRLLECMADSVLGHTALAIYPYLQSTEHVLGAVRDEATIDSIADRLKALRQQAKTDVDRRALDLLELLVERRAAELQNQPGPHVDRAVAALHRSTQGAWQPGERRLMSGLLAHLGRIASEPLSAAQSKLLGQLYRDSDAGSFDRLSIAQDYATTIWSYSRWNESLEVLQAALDEFRAASGGVLPESANDVLTKYVGQLESRGQFARAETVLLADLKPQRAWRVEHLYRLYDRALTADATVSLGKGLALYRNVIDQLDKELDAADPNHRHQLIATACSLYKTAHDLHFEEAVADLQKLADKRLPDLLGRNTANYSQLVGTVADTLHHITGPRAALKFLIERTEQQPRWLRLTNEDIWVAHCHRCSQWRVEAKDIGDLEPRLLALVVAELKLELRSRDARHREIYWVNSGWFWPDKAGDFARAAEEVLAEQPDSAARIRYVAEYFFTGLGRPRRAIEILLAADQRRLLDEAGRTQMVNYLQSQRLWEESIPPLLELMELRPLALQYRTQLMRAYFGTQQHDQLLSLLEQTDEYFHSQGQWQENTIAELAASTLLNGLETQSVAYYREAISLHERTHPNRGVGDGKLSEYYDGLSQALAGLDRTSEAVDAASAAIVSWGPRKEERAAAIDQLKHVLSTARDLAQFGKTLDDQVAASGLENPIVRKALGQVLLEQEDFDAAIRQLRLAIEAQPNDPDIYRALVEAYGRAEQPESAIEQLLVLADLTPRDLELYKEIGDRYEQLNDLASAERARTSIIEAQPNEAESHAMLAEIRQEQQRLSEAADQWQTVARLRALEPTGLLRLAEAQIQLKQWTAAAATLRKLSTTGWPEQVGNVNQQVEQMRQQIEDGRGENRKGAKSQR